LWPFRYCHHAGAGWLSPFEDTLLGGARVCSVRAVRRGVTASRISTSSPYVIRVLAALLSVLASSCASIEGLGAPPDPGDTEMPAGCQQSVCDYLYAWCTDPCAECWTSCGRAREEFEVIRCSETCTATCTSDKTATPSPCDARLRDCRSTERNTVCIDQLAADIPRGLPPCSSEMSAARCACGKDDVCQGLLEHFNPLCEGCDRDSKCSRPRDRHGLRPSRCLFGGNGATTEARRRERG
jgi:hypothetical protein